MNFTLDKTSRTTLGILVAAAAFLGWAFFPTFDWMVEKWLNDPQYSHGFLVPLVSGYLLYRKWISPSPLEGEGRFERSEKRGEGFGENPRNPSPRRPADGDPLPQGERVGLAAWLGKPWPIVGGIVLAFSLGLRFIAGGLLFHQLDALAFLLSLAALAMLAGGGKLLKVTAPAIGFLVFMVPLPYELERNVGGPLKIVATESSTFLLQTLGYPAVPEGNIIRMDEVELGVVDACSGLKMLMTFAAFAAGAVLMLDRTWFEKMMVVLGILPIAVVTNVLRITATGVAYTLTTDKASREWIHDVDGWLMMPVGLGFLAFQLWALGRLVVKAQEQAVISGPAFGMNVRMDAGTLNIPTPHFAGSSVKV